MAAVPSRPDAHDAFDPRSLDVSAFAASGGRLEGRLPLGGLRRLLDGAEPAGDGEVAWHAVGSAQPVEGAGRCPGLVLGARAAVVVACQRCLQPLELGLDVDRPIAFAPDEESAERLDEANEIDVLAMPHRLDLLELLEDELVLAMPLVPRHEVCPDPPQLTDPADATLETAENPFAALAAWKGRSAS
jgi:uncharacterized protein